MLFWWIWGGESVLPVLLLRHLGSSPCNCILIKLYLQKQTLGWIWSIGSSLQISYVEESGGFLGRYLSMITLKMDKNKRFFIFSTWMVSLPSYYPEWVKWLILQRLFVSLLYFFFFCCWLFCFYLFWPCYMTYIWDFYFTRYWTQALGSENTES